MLIREIGPVDFDVALHVASMGHEHCRGSLEGGGKIPVREKRGGKWPGRECRAGANHALDAGAGGRVC